MDDAGVIEGFGRALVCGMLRSNIVGPDEHRAMTKEVAEARHSKSNGEKLEPHDLLVMTGFQSREHLWRRATIRVECLPVDEQNRCQSRRLTARIGKEVHRRQGIYGKSTRLFALLLEDA